MAKERITITLDRRVLEKVDRMVDSRNIRNRSHAIEHCLMQAYGRINTALVLAGGTAQFGKSSVPKPMIKVHGKPVIEHQLNMLKKNGITNVIVAPGKNKLLAGNGVTIVNEKVPLGTAGPLCLAKDFINDAFVMLNVDTLVNANVQQIFEFHKAQGMLATVLLVTVDNPTRYGIVKMCGNRISDFSEKPRTSDSMLINGGFHIFEPEVLDYIPRKRFMIEDLFKRLLKESQVAGYLFDGKVIDVGSAHGLKLAEREWVDVK